MLNIRLARTGRKRDAHFRVVVSDSKHGRVGRILETVGYYHPRMANDAEGRLHIDRDRARYWLGHGARPSPTVRSFLRRMLSDRVLSDPSETPPEQTVDSDAPAPESLPAAPADTPAAPATPAGTSAAVTAAAAATPPAPPPAG